ncbi:hypothetical protein STEG23_001981 [Scotinomys teguina]
MNTRASYMAFQDISTYFSEEEWAKLNKWQKSAYAYMKRNYLRLTGLGVTVNQPVFMRPKQQAKDSLVKCTPVHGCDIEDPLDMKTMSSCFESSMEANHGPKSMCEAFQDISTYFSEEEWAKLNKWQKSAYAYMKRNYLRLTGLGVTVNQPVFMRPKQQAKDSLVKCTPVHGRDIEGEWSGDIVNDHFFSMSLGGRGNQAFQDISTYFSEEEWAKLNKWQKSAYAYMKRNYLRLTGLGVTVNQPVFMRPKQQAKDSLVKCTPVHGCDIEDPLDMKTMSSCFESSMEANHGPKSMCEAFQDISTYFSEEEWAKLNKWQKSAYAYMKRNYLRLTGLGVTVNQPVFMRPKQQAKDSLVKCTPVHGRDIEDPLKMKTMSSCFESPVEATHGPKIMSEAFQDISTYFSEEEWAKLNKWQKSAYVYMKRNYLRMTGLGVTVKQPVFMRPKQQAKDSLVKCTPVHGCDIEDSWTLI